MSNKTKQEASAKKEQYKKNIKGEKLNSIMNSLEAKANSIGVRDKYKERIKTSYLSIVLYFVLIMIFYNKINIMSISDIDMIKPGISISGVIICIYNIVKSIMSIKDDKSKTANKVLIGIHILFIIVFIAMLIGF